MKHFLRLSVATLLFCGLGWNAFPAETNHNFAVWEKAISAFERMDATNAPARGTLEFTGSSTIARWATLREDFAGRPVYNRGFGGSWVMDSTHFAPRTIFPYAPAKIFFRAGGNDLAAGKTVAEVFADYQEFTALVHSNLPSTEIYYISWNATPARWKQHEAEKALNQLIADFSRDKTYLKYIEAYDVALDAQGQPRPELFVPDKLHFNRAGYELLAARVRPYVTLPATNGAAK